MTKGENRSLPILMDGGKWSRDNRDKYDKLNFIWDFGMQSTLSTVDKEAFALSPTKTLKGNYSAAWTYCGPMRIKRADWHARKKCPLTPLWYGYRAETLLAQWSMRQRITEVWSIKQCCWGGQTDREGHKGLIAKRDRTTNSSVLEANVGRMPTIPLVSDVQKIPACAHPRTSIKPGNPFLLYQNAT